MANENFGNLDKNFNFKEAETKWYKFWEENGLFSFDPEAKGEPFVMIIPPPNVTGNLHMGHAFNNTLQDILVRYHRMKGDNTCWIPGMDHAGIATQNVVERDLEAQNIKKETLGREKFIEKVWEWKEKYGSNIANQFRRMGASCDWSRERFTMDEGLSKAVIEIFVRLYNDNLIYKGDYIVNWCPRCQTALADLEVEHAEHEHKLYYVKYPAENGTDYISIATTRPETIFGDTAVAVNPNDERYKQLIGKKVKVPLTSRYVEVIADDYIDIEFGTGVLKVTPAHDINDFNIGLKHNLEIINCIDDFGFLTAATGKYEGLERFEARQVVEEDLEKENLLLKVEPLVHSVGTCYRCQTVLEPKLSKQWFVKIAPLAEKALKAVKEKETNFIPQMWEKIYFEWMENIRDWCISRQLWWGHRIPAWFCDDCGEINVAKQAPTTCQKCSSSKLSQETDVLDTWFSSALWPFSTLGWPEKTAELEKYYPTSMVITGFDIIFFWVARMMMMGIYAMDDVPFKEVLIHALVLDKDGQKMSKSKGNVINPLTVIDEFGADAFRFTFCALAGQGRDIRLSEDRIIGYSKFINKIWNAAKFTLANSGNAKLSLIAPKASNVPDKWILSRLNKVAQEARTALTNYQYDRLADVLYHFTWNEFCDWYLELIKPILYGDNEKAKAETQNVLLYVFSAILRLLHPIMPFVTEELWFKIPESNTSIMRIMYPGSEEDDFIDEDAENKINFIMDVATAVRQIRADFSVPLSEKFNPLVKTNNKELVEVLNSYGSLLLRMIGADSIEATENEKPHDAATVTYVWGEVWVPLAKHIDLGEETKRLNKEIEALNKNIKAAEAKLKNEDYITKAPKEIVAETKGRLEEFKVKIETLNKAVELLKEMLG